MIDLLPYLKQLSKEYLIYIGVKYKIKYVEEHLDKNRLASIIYNNLSREKVYNELFNSGRTILYQILIEDNLLKEISEEFHISDTSLGYLLQKVSSSNPMIQVNAIKLLLKHHPQKSGVFVYIWNTIDLAIYPGKSWFIISNIWEELENSRIPDYHEMLNHLLNNLSRLYYDLDPSEIKVLLDIAKKIMDNMRGNVTVESLERSLDFLLNEGPDPTQIQYKELLDTNTDGWISISQKHITGLIIDVSSITRSILHLTKLKWLQICQYDNRNKNSLIKIPDFLEELPELRYIYIGSVNLVEIPQWIKEKVRTRHSKKYIKRGVVEKDAFVLGLIEILLNREIPSVEWLASEGLYGDDIDTVLQYSHYHYIKNEFGRVTAITIDDYFIACDLHIIPDEITTLDALEELTISSYFLRIVPDSLIQKIQNLPNLKRASIVRSGPDFKMFLNTGF